MDGQGLEPRVTLWVVWFTARCNSRYASHPFIYRHISPRPLQYLVGARHSWRPGSMGGRVLHAGVLVLTAPCWRRAPGARRNPPAGPDRIQAAAGGSRPSRPGFRRASTTVRIVRELPGGGMSPRFRWEPREPCGYRAGTTKKPPANLSAYRGFRDAGSPLTCAAVGLRPTTRRC